MAEGGDGERSSDIPRVPSHCQHHEPSNPLQYEEESKEVCIVMSLLGYGPECRQKRRTCYSEYARLGSAYSLSIGIYKVIIAGSKSEGLTCSMENDIDYLLVLLNVFCLEDCLHIRDIPDDTVALMMDTTYTSAGHYRLLLLRRAKNSQTAASVFIEQALCDDGHGHALLSSALFADTGQDILRSGPSTPLVVGPIHQDRVIALRCHSTVLLKQWAERPRHWPPTEVVKKVISLEAILTPVGFKESPYKHVEWRLCFSSGETEIMNNLTDTQLKMYVMLKLIVKDILRPQHKEVTSYTLKNIILWQAESYPQTLFNERSLFYWLREGLGRLKTAIATKHLKYYMIPERNLMAGCGLRPYQQSKWIAVITEMINEGPRIILRLEKIRKAVIAYPEPLMWYSKMRTELEMLMLEYTVRMGLFFENESVSDKHNMVFGVDLVEQFVQRVSRCFAFPDSIIEELDARIIEIVNTIALNLNVDCDVEAYVLKHIEMNNKHLEYANSFREELIRNKVFLLLTYWYSIKQLLQLDMTNTL